MKFMVAKRRKNRTRARAAREKEKIESGAEVRKARGPKRTAQRGSLLYRVGDDCYHAHDSGAQVSAGVYGMAV